MARVSTDERNFLSILARGKGKKCAHELLKTEPITHDAIVEDRDAYYGGIDLGRHFFRNVALHAGIVVGKTILFQSIRSVNKGLRVVDADNLKKVRVVKKGRGREREGPLRRTYQR